MQMVAYMIVSRRSGELYLTLFLMCIYEVGWVYYVGSTTDCYVHSLLHNKHLLISIYSRFFFVSKCLKHPFFGISQLYLQRRFFPLFREYRHNFLSCFSNSRNCKEKTKVIIIRIKIFWPSQGCRIHQLHLCRGVRLPQQLPWIWDKTIWWGGFSNDGVLRNAKYFLITITPRSTPAQW